MTEIIARSVDEGLYQGVQRLIIYGVEYPSRNGPMVESPSPVTTRFINPDRRVSFCPVRDANPFFHLFEAMWMLSGSDSVLLPSYYAKKIADFSDDGRTLNGAYGHRWRYYFNTDNLHHVIRLLKEDPYTRRAYLPMWDPFSDGKGSSLDYPCNVGINFRVRDRQLNMHVFCRSNDIIWGLYGANHVHFSFLMEYVAAAVGVEIGIYYHTSDSFHAYTELPKWKALKDMLVNRTMDIERLTNDYQRKNLIPVPLVRLDEPPDMVIEDAEVFSEQYRVPGYQNYRTGFFKDVVVPMNRAWHERDIKYLSYAIDWHRAGIQWIDRRKQK